MEEKEQWKNNSDIKLGKFTIGSERHQIQGRRLLKSRVRLVISFITSMLRRMIKAYGARKRDSGLRISREMETAYTHV
jgi:hypothetical protein